MYEVLSFPSASPRIRNYYWRMKLNLAFMGCCALAIKDDVGQISALPGGTFNRHFGKWEIALNGEKLQAEVKFNGWPAGIIDPCGGIIAAGEIANEDSFIQAIEDDLGKPIEEYMSVA